MERGEDLPERQSVLDAVERAVRECPERSAIETEGERICYLDFRLEFRDFATRLEALTAPGEFIGIMANRTAASIIAMVGALAAGRPFVFIDPRDNESSNRLKVSSLGLRAIAGDPSSPRTPVLAEIPAEWRAETRGHRVSPGGDLTARHGRIGYAIHTSGSTGEPKCVLVRADPLAPMIRDHVRRLDLSPRSRTLQFARLTFDGCITEILWTLAAGACLVIPRQERVSPGPMLQETLEDLQVTHLKTTPFALTVTQPTRAMSLEHVINGGGACRPSVVRKWSSVTAFHNAYGTTETTVCNFLSGRLDPSDCAESVPLGDLVGDCGYQIVPLPPDAREDLTDPRASRGELVITGESVAVGYLTTDGVQLFTDGLASRTYRTGDIVEHRDGRVFFVDRLDRQLKVRGYRLDPGEIEAAACRLPGVMDAVVVAESHEDGPGAEDPADALVCYYQGDMAPRQLRSHLDAVIDPYKVPSLIQQVERLPYTKNGKVDREALRTVRSSSAAAFPVGSPEEQVLHLVRRLTGVSDAGLDENFFNIGGDSASTLVLVSKLKELGWMDAGVRDVLRAESLQDLISELRTRIA